MRKYSSNITGVCNNSCHATILPGNFKYFNELYTNFRINSTIVANTAKNKRKAEKKKRALERRMSEGDAEGSFEVLNKLPASSSMDLSMMNEGRHKCPFILLFAHKLVFELRIFIKSPKFLHNQS